MASRPKSQGSYARHVPRAMTEPGQRDVTVQAIVPDEIGHPHATELRELLLDRHATQEVGDMLVDRHVRVAVSRSV